MANPPALARYLLILMAAALLACGDGCAGKAAEIPVYPVKGRVTVDSVPLKAGRISLYPESGGENQLGVPWGLVNASGGYTIFFQGREGAPQGSYKVTVAPPDDSAGPRPNQKYTKLETTDLHLEVAESPPSADAYDLKLKR